MPPNKVIGAELFQPADQARLENTLLTYVLQSDDRISDTVGSRGKFNNFRAAVLRWARLGRRSAAVRDRLTRLSQLPEFARDLTALPTRMMYRNLPAPTAGKPVTK